MKADQTTDHLSEVQRVGVPGRPSWHLSKACAEQRITGHTPSPRCRPLTEEEVAKRRRCKRCVPADFFKEDKLCSSCNERKPRSEFAKNRNHTEGLTYICRACDIAQTKAWRKENPDRVKRNRQASNQRHPEKQRARWLLIAAVREGRVIKPTRCEDCGTEFSWAGSIHGHHTDYSKPLDVRWLCQRCHTAEHARLAKEEA